MRGATPLLLLALAASLLPAGVAWPGDPLPEGVFRERVEGDRYFIKGVGIYGADRQVVEIYTGRYRRVRSP